MVAVIMAGGKGTRLQALTNNEIPKPMVMIAGKPILQWQIEALRQNKIIEIIIVVGHLKEKIQSFFKDGNNFNVHIRYIEEPFPMGTAGALSMLDIQEDFVFLYGDLIFDINIDRMYQFHLSHAATITSFIHPNDHPEDSDLVLTNNEHITGIISKNTRRDCWYHNCTNAGFYIVNPSICANVPYAKVEFERDILVNTSNIFGYSSSEYIKDVGTVTRIYQVEKDLYNNIPTKRNLYNKQKAIFLDRDGTINQEVGLISDPSQLILIPKVIDAIKMINQSTYLAIIVTNQPVIAKGMCNLETLNIIHSKLETLLGHDGAYIDAIYYCPHHPDRGFKGENLAYKINCNCRKPKIGMLQAAAKDFNIDLTQSWIIGDREIDIQTGLNAGTQTALIASNTSIKANITTSNLYDAVMQILEK